MDGMAQGAISYLGDSTVRAVANKIEKEVANFGLSDLDNLINRYLPGKRNKHRRKMVKHHIANKHGSAAAPVAINRRVGRMAPRFRSVGGNYHVSNREFVADINGSTSFSLEEFTCQPGLASLFPWLSQIAPTHQKYKFTKLVFSYVPIASTSAQGRVTMAHAIDPLDDTVADKQELFQYPNSTESSVWASSTLSVNLASKGWLYTRNGFVANSDLKTYDAGKFLIATSNTEDDSVIGELFVDYEVQLMTPKPAKCPSSSLTLAGTDITAVDPLIDFRGSLPLEADGGDWFFARRVAGQSLVVFRYTGDFVVTLDYTSSTTGGIIINDGDNGAGNDSIVFISRASADKGSTAVATAHFRVAKRRDSQGLLPSVSFGASGGGGSFVDVTSVRIKISTFDTTNEISLTA